MDQARSMWTLYEPVHLVTYFSPAARAAYEAVGLRGYWRGYFGGRAAAFGAVGPGPVYATFFNFHRAMVARAVPDVWSRASPAVVLGARLDGARAALDEVLAPVPASDVAEAAELLRAAAGHADVAGRALAGAIADLPWPTDPVGVLWHAATLLREQRGDGHVAALLAAGLDGAETLVWRSAMDSDREVLQGSRGWSDAEWEAAAGRLVERGWLAPDGTPTTVALIARDDIERRTDELASAPWRRLGEEVTTRLQALLHPIALAARAYLPPVTPIVLPPPRSA